MASTPFQPYASSHIDPQGPGDSRPTAQQILEDCDAISNLTQKSILITGASSGLGVATAAALYRTGAQLYLMGLFGKRWAFGWIGSVIPWDEFTTKSDRCLDHDKWV